MLTLDELESWVSHERIAPYRLAYGGDPGQVIATYQWNAYVSAALWSTLGHVEGLLRNAFHQQLSQWSKQRYGDDRWYLHILEFVNQQTAEDISDARRRATRNSRDETPGRVVAELNLGFWRYLLARRYDGTLWRFSLHRAFPRKRRVEIERVISDLHLLRNRIGHHEPIYAWPLRRLRDEALKLSAWIDPKASNWIKSNDLSEEFLEQRPRKTVS